MTGGMGKIERYLTFKVCLLKIPTLAVKRLARLNLILLRSLEISEKRQQSRWEIIYHGSWRGKATKLFYSHIEELKMTKEWPKEQIFD